jgi:hypothetical protein
MNAPFTPVDLHTFDDAFRLLAIAADLSATRQRLDELKTAEASAKERIAELHAMQAETVRLHSTAQATNIVADNRIKALDVRETEIDTREAKLEQSEAMKSDAGLRRRESAVEARENAAKAESDRLAVMRKDIDARLAKIKSFSSSL